MKQTFGAFIRQKRLAKMIKLHVFASQIGISNVYLSYIETGKRPAPSRAILQRIKTALELSDDETALMYSLASISHNKHVFPDDMINYINNRPYVMKTMHIALEHNAGEEEWTTFRKIVEFRKQNNKPGKE